MDDPFFAEDIPLASLHTTASTQTATAFARLFATPDGQAVLAALRRRTIERPTLATGSGGGVCAYLMCVREGENQLVRTIETLIKKGKTHD